MNHSGCKKVVSMLFLYIENKLNNHDKLLVENHICLCNDCYNKYLEMKNIIKNLHFEYEKMKDEFERTESNQIFNIREYESFYNNISPYIDDELNYDESLKFRKYLLKSKPARIELANAYKLKNNIKHSVDMFKDNLNVNFSKKIIKKLKEGNKYSYETVYMRAAAIIGIMITVLVIFSLYMGVVYFNRSYAKSFNPENTKISIEFPDNKDMVEFTFDERGIALLVNK